MYNKLIFNLIFTVISRTHNILANVIDVHLELSDSESTVYHYECGNADLKLIQDTGYTISTSQWV